MSNEKEMIFWSVDLISVLMYINTSILDIGCQRPFSVSGLETVVLEAARRGAGCEGEHSPVVVLPEHTDPGPPLRGHALLLQHPPHRFAGPPLALTALQNRQSGATVAELIMADA